MKLTEIQDLIKFVARAGVTEVEIEQKDFKLTIKSEMPKGRGRKDEALLQTFQVPAAVPQAVITPPVAVAPSAPAAPTPAEAPAAEAAAPKTPANVVEIKSPMIGTFYRRPSPDKGVFCEVGDTIKVGDTVCVIEAMKLFNEIESEIKGKIVKVLVDDNSPVEYDQPLFLVEPA
ncbi:MAG: acetyl-CoA carboxylase biotin carboxyl carrier protein [Bacteroidetes bacterium]|nr:acetyl-CoA carboxylase biotin carboxyl carrier protein [Bacteroidota bacterium]MDA0903378.1 acetyl-CoA carboxylase biotin carboxyl carrier protein [Bacteroidota bacterium]MDA1241590.1 acetyl-CoA carboxylase biotin carboxyl carrier protein [Bacteroidota bacterium]